MGERHLVVDRLKFSYEGFFNASELYNLISGFFYEKGWDWYEKLNDEQVTPKGKQITIHLHPWKSVSDFYKIMMIVKIHMIDVRDVEVEKEGEQLRLSHGVIRMIINGFVVSDRSGQWSEKPLWWFLGIIFERFLFKRHLNRMKTWIAGDVDELYNKVKSYLNVVKYSYHT